MGTGFSRIIEPEKKGEGKDGAKPEDAADPKEYFGYKRDLESLCEFMGRWLSEHGRWGSPVFIAGESYGGYRVGRLARMLQEAAGIGLNGAILISPALEITGLAPTDYDVLGWIDRVPTMAAAAFHHGRSRAFRKGTSLEKVFRESEEFATGDYATFLTRGASIPRRSATRILSRLADVIGLAARRRHPRRGSRRNPALRPRAAPRRAQGARPLRHDDHRDRPVPGSRRVRMARSDALGHQPGVHDGREPDAALGDRRRDGPRVHAAVATRSTSRGRTTPQQHAFAPPPGATDDFRYGMALNPHMKAFITHGQYDLVTPYYASDRLRNLMRLDPQMADRLTVQHFGGGHMFYAWEASRHAFTAAIAAFVADAT